MGRCNPWWSPALLGGYKHILCVVDVAAAYRMGESFDSIAHLNELPIISYSVKTHFLNGITIHYLGIE